MRLSGRRLIGVAQGMTGDLQLLPLRFERLDADQRRAAKKLLREQRMKIGANDPDGLHRLLGE